MILNTKLNPIVKGDLSGVYMIPIIREKWVRNLYVGIIQRKFSITCKVRLVDIKYNGRNTDLSRLNKKENSNILFNEGR